jgi:FtsH-binding integral membrane protein
MTIAGYKPEDLIAAPTAPPQPIKTEKRSATHNSSVLFLVGIGVLLAIVGVVLMLGTLPVLGFIVAVVGALAIAASVFVPFKE